MAWRGLRAGLGGFFIFMACIAIGVAAIVGVGSVSRGFADGLANQARNILGGDVSFALMHRPASQAELAWLTARSAVSVVAEMRAMARTGVGGSTLIDLKAVGLDWPSQGSAALDPNSPVSDLLAERNNVFGMIADPALLARLGVGRGDRLEIGTQAFQVRAVLISEPDALAGGIALGPRVIISRAALHHAGLLQPGALVRWIYRASLKVDHAGPPTDAEAEAFVRRANEAFPSAGWQAKTRANVSPQFSQSLKQLSQFLTLVALTALMVGGVGVANGARAFVERKIEDFAVLKSVGASGGFVFLTSLAQIMSVAALGTAAGVLIGALLPFALSWGFAALIPIPFTPAVFWDQIAVGAFYGLVTAFSFSVIALGRAHDAPVASLFRDRLAAEPGLPRVRYVAMAAIAFGVLLAAIICFSTDRRIAAIYVAAAAAAFILLRASAVAVIAAARLAPSSIRVELRLALANICRPGALTPTILLSLGLGLSLIVAISFVGGNLRSEIGQAKPNETPSLFFLDVPRAQSASFKNFVKTHAPSAKLAEAPMMRGRVTRLNGTPVDKIKAKQAAAWVLEGDRGVTFAPEPPAGTRLVAGSWWPKNYSGPPLVSMDAKIARELGLSLGETVTLNVLGRDVTARIASLRDVNWRTMGINFVFVFSPDAFAGAPYTALATATYPQSAAKNADLRLLREVADAYPMITVIRVKDALEALNALLDKVTLAMRCASGVVLTSAVLVLAGALASGQKNRIYEAVVLKTVGATRPTLMCALLIEYGLLGVAAALMGAAIGAAAAEVVLTRVMDAQTFEWIWSAAIEAAACSLVISVALGMLLTYRALGQKPASYLRAL